MDAKQKTAEVVDRHRDALIQLSTNIHDNPETAFKEVQAAGWVAAALAEADFTVERGVCGIDTAIKATFGSGELNIVICAEYDALPNIGHACGHNIIAASAVGAAIALARVADEIGVTVTVLGTPAEEDGGAKTLMLSGGAFDGTHVAMMVHAYAEERDAMGTLAVSQLDVEFFGKPAHAAAHPEDGVSASAALALAQSGIAFLREHLLPSDRIHGIVAFGGDAPNIVPDHTTGRWYVRATALEHLAEIEPKVVDVFRGAALMTGCRMELRKSSPTYADVRTDERMAALWRSNAAALGRDSKPLQPGDPRASTDMGNVSYAVPTIHPLVKIEAGGSNIHQAEFAAAAGTESAHDAIVFSAKNMARVVIDMATNDSFRADLVARPYVAADVDDRTYLDEDWRTVVEFDPAGQ